MKFYSYLSTIKHFYLLIADIIMIYDMDSFILHLILKY